MKMGGFFFIILMIVGSVLVTGCVLKPTNNETIVQTLSLTTVPSAPIKTTPVILTTVPTLREIPQGVPFGRLSVSIGNYNASLPVFVDNMSAGQVSAGKMLNLKVIEGSHIVRICYGSVWETIDVNIYSAITTTIDFEERLNRELPQGSLNVSLGDYNARLPVYIDNSSVGNVSISKPFYQLLSAGNYTVKICTIDDCFTEDVEIKPANQTMVDFGSRLRSEGRLADLTVSIEGYNAQNLPVFLDNTSAGLVSHGNPLMIKVNTGVHEVKVCSGMVCPNKQIEVKFGKHNFMDFGEQLIKDAVYLEPTVRIVDYSMSGSTLTLNTEYINPSTKDLTMTATFSCTYTYVDRSTDESERERMSSTATNALSRSVRAGNRTLTSINLYLSGGRDYLLSPPVVLTVTTS